LNKRHEEVFSTQYNRFIQQGLQANPRLRQPIADLGNEDG
jgi:hypothetical protein